MFGLLGAFFRKDNMFTMIMCNRSVLNQSRAKTKIYPGVHHADLKCGHHVSEHGSGRRRYPLDTCGIRHAKAPASTPTRHPEGVFQGVSALSWIFKDFVGIKSPQNQQVYQQRHPGVGRPEVLANKFRVPDGLAMIEEKKIQIYETQIVIDVNLHICSM